MIIYVASSCKIDWTDWTGILTQNVWPEFLADSYDVWDNYRRSRQAWDRDLFRNLVVNTVELG